MILKIQKERRLLKNENVAGCLIETVRLIETIRL
jgi:hypothetical protein